MKPELLDSLLCPTCGGRWAAGETGGAPLLRCCGCGREVPVLDGIPRFVEQQHLASFGHQWNRYEVAHDAEDRATFTAKTGMQLEELRGCGCWTPAAAAAGTPVWLERPVRP